MIKKTTLAIFMAGLMLATIFSAISVSAGYREHEIGPVETVDPYNPNPTDPPDGLTKNGHIAVTVSGILNFNKIDGATVRVMGLNYFKEKTTDEDGFAAFGFLSGDNDFLPVSIFGSFYLITVEHPDYYPQFKLKFLQWDDLFYSWKPNLIPKIDDGASGSISHIDIDVINDCVIV